MISYASAPFPVREDLAEAHEHFWRRVASAGTWWSGAERVAIAAETRAARTCRLCAERKQSLSPNAVAGEHDRATDLSPAAVEAVHRVVTDPGRLSQAWLERTLRGGLSHEAYVELVGVLAGIVSIDAFCIGLGLPVNELPSAEPGSPSRYRPEKVVEGEAWVPILDAVTAPAESDLWTADFAPYVARALSLVPDEVRSWMELSRAHYLAKLEDVPNPMAQGRILSRPQMELIAGRVSALNQCFY